LSALCTFGRINTCATDAPIHCVAQPSQNLPAISADSNKPGRWYHAQVRRGLKRLTDSNKPPFIIMEGLGVAGFAGDAQRRD
jgi:hypothetical protein